MCDRHRKLPWRLHTSVAPRPASLVPSNRPLICRASAVIRPPRPTQDGLPPLSVRGERSDVGIAPKSSLRGELPRFALAPRRLLVLARRAADASAEDPTEVVDALKAGTLGRFGDGGMAIGEQPLGVV